MLSNLLQKFTALGQREKWLVSAALLVVFWGGWDTFFYTPLKKQHTELQQRLTDLQTQLVVQQQAVMQLQNRSYTDPNLSQQQQLLALKADYQSLQQQMLQLKTKFVPPALMARVLADLLKKNSQLKLIKLDTLPVTTLSNLKQQDYLIYKHGLVLHFSGNYLATLKYLKSLELMPWHFLWGSIDYRVKSYPVAEITLRVYTLSLEKDWLDV